LISKCFSQTEISDVNRLQIVTESISVAKVQQLELRRIPAIVKVGAIDQEPAIEKGPDFSIDCALGSESVRAGFLWFKHI